MRTLTLKKDEKLCSRTAIDTLFSDGRSVIAYPLRAVYRATAAAEGAAPCRMLITIPKKKIRHAVDRVRLRRRVREAYRLNRRDVLFPALSEAGVTVDVAFIYLDTAEAPYATISDKMCTIMRRMVQQIAPAHETSVE